LEELDLLKKVEVIIPLGQIAFTQTLKSLRLKGYDVPPLSFGHGKSYTIPPGDRLRTLSGRFMNRPYESRTISLMTTYHPSQQNTQTGKLTRAMFHRIFRMVKKRLEVEG
jgi:uracil-DNA glycosylase